MVAEEVVEAGCRNPRGLEVPGDSYCPGTEAQAEVEDAGQEVPTEASGAADPAGLAVEEEERGLERLVHPVS